MNKLKQLYRSIDTVKHDLILSAEKNGVYENFGQRDYRVLHDKFIDTCDYSSEMNNARNALSAFSDWAATYTPYKI